jgi:hypothetical protein
MCKSCNCEKCYAFLLKLFSHGRPNPFEFVHIKSFTATGSCKKKYFIIGPKSNFLIGNTDIPVTCTISY